MSFNKHRHAKYTSQSRHYFQNSISKIGGFAARDDYFAPNYGQKSPELGSTPAGAYSGYSEQEMESEIDGFRSVRCHERNYDKELFNMTIIIIRSIHLKEVLGFTNIQGKDPVKNIIVL